MQNKFGGTKLGILVLTWMMLAFCALRAQQTNATEAQLTAFLYSYEFKASEMAELKALPMDAVDVLTTLLNSKKIGELHEARIFQCLSIKFIQYENTMLQAQKEKAILSLQAKLQDASDKSRSFKAHFLQGVQSPSLVKTLNSIDYKVF